MVVVNNYHIIMWHNTILHYGRKFIKHLVKRFIFGNILLWPYLVVSAEGQSEKLLR